MSAVEIAVAPGRMDWCVCPLHEPCRCGREAPVRRCACMTCHFGSVCRDGGIVVADGTGGPR